MDDDEEEKGLITKGEFIPTLAEELNYELQPFKPVDEAADDEATTEADLSILNNHLAMCDGALPKVRTIAGLCALSATACKLIELRRKVKKLPLGVDATKDPKRRTFEVIE